MKLIAGVVALIIVVVILVIALTVFITKYVDCEQAASDKKSSFVEQVVEDGVTGDDGSSPKVQTVSDKTQDIWLETTYGEVEYNPEHAGDQAAQISDYSEQKPELDYSDMITKMSTTDKTRARQREWAEEVGPKSRTALQVDNMDEAAEISNRNGWGLRTFDRSRPKQENPLQISAY